MPGPSSLHGQQSSLWSADGLPSQAGRCGKHLYQLHRRSSTCAIPVSPFVGIQHTHPMAHRVALRDASCRSTVELLHKFVVRHLRRIGTFSLCSIQECSSNCDEGHPVGKRFAPELEHAAIRAAPEQSKIQVRDGCVVDGSRVRHVGFVAGGSTIYGPQLTSDALSPLEEGGHCQGRLSSSPSASASPTSCAAVR